MCEWDIANICCCCNGKQETFHAANIAAGKDSVGFPSSKPLTQFRNPLNLSEVNLSCGDIFIIIKAIAQQGANYLAFA